MGGEERVPGHLVPDMDTSLLPGLSLFVSVGAMGRGMVLVGLKDAEGVLSAPWGVWGVLKKPAPLLEGRGREQKLTDRSLLSIPQRS